MSVTPFVLSAPASDLREIHAHIAADDPAVARPVLDAGRSVQVGEEVGGLVDVDDRGVVGQGAGDVGVPGNAWVLLGCRPASASWVATVERKVLMLP